MQPQESKRPAVDDFAFCHDMRVRWRDLDAHGVVFNPNYFVFFEIGVAEYFREIGYSPTVAAKLDTDVFAINASANFHAPALLDDEIRIGVRTAYIGTTSLRFEIGLFRTTDLLVDGSLTYVNVGRQSRVAVPIPEHLIDRLVALERVPPLRK